MLNENSKEIVLREITVSKSSRKDKIKLSFVISFEEDQTAACWAVSTERTSISPISLFDSSDEALEDMNRRVGQACIQGGIVTKNLYWGEIRGSFNNKPVLIKQERAQQTPISKEQEPVDIKRRAPTMKLVIKD